MDLPTLEAEERFWACGMQRVAGLDEAGRGAWAGPVVAAAVILPRGDGIHAALVGVRIVKVALAVGVGRGEQHEIDALGIVPATRLAMQRALSALSVAPEALIVDALSLPGVNLPQDVFPYADARSLSVAAASIIAKVSRDRWMVNVAEVDFPGYGFAQHKGYGTPQHQASLAHLGVCPIHRLSFRPVAECVAAANAEIETANHANLR